MPKDFLIREHPVPICSMYLQNWVIFGVNVGIHIPAPWFASGVQAAGISISAIIRSGCCKVHSCRDLNQATAQVDESWSRTLPGTGVFRGLIFF